MKNIFIFQMIIAFFAISSCANSNNQNNAEENKNLLAIHGQFCGKAHPAYLSSSAAEHAQRISLIPAQDDLDQICKNHDLCYARSGFGAQNCDITLEKEANNLVFAIGGTNSRYCLSKKLAVLSFSQFNNRSLSTSSAVLATAFYTGTEAVASTLDNVANLIPESGRDVERYPDRSEFCNSLSPAEIQEIENRAIKRPVGYQRNSPERQLRRRNRRSRR